MKMSIILLPKEGKDINNIKNWRPITLYNCDSKIVTKALALRMNSVLDEIIDVNQTAYVKGCRFQPVELVIFSIFCAKKLKKTRNLQQNFAKNMFF